MALCPTACLLYSIMLFTLIATPLLPSLASPQARELLDSPGLNPVVVSSLLPAYQIFFKSIYDWVESVKIYAARFFHI